MSEKESVEEKKAPTENDKADEDQAEAKSQKRKKPAKAVEPSTKKSKLDEEAAATENAKDSQSDDEDGTDEDEKAPPGLLDRSPEVTGTRVRKQVERLAMNSPAVAESPDRRKNEMLPGKGNKLGTSPRILAQLQSSKHSDLTLIHRLLFKRIGKSHEIKKNIKEFSGFTFSKEDKEFESRKHTLEKTNLTDLKHVCLVLDLERSGSKESIVERILEFLLYPTPSTKPLPAKKTKKSKDKEIKKKKSPTKTGSAKKSSPKKPATSNETVDDSSSSSSDSSSSEDEESEKEEKKTPSPPAKKAKKPVATPKASKENPSAKSDKKKASPKKSPKKAEIKIKLPAVNKTKKKLESDSEDNKKKEVAPKEVEKEKSPPKKSTDEPTDAELVKTIKQILKDANLENFTMKNLCLKVYEKYPKSDLEKTKKDFIRSTAKEILGNGD